MKQHLSFREVHPPQLYAHPSIKQLTTALALKAATWGDRHTIKQTIENTTDYGSCNSPIKGEIGRLFDNAAPIVANDADDARLWLPVWE